MDKNSTVDPFAVLDDMIQPLKSNVVPFHGNAVPYQADGTAPNPAEQLLSIARQLSDQSATPLEVLMRQVNAEMKQGQPATKSKRVRLSDYMKPDTKDIMLQEIENEEIFKRFGLFKGDRPGIIVAQSGIGKSTLLIQEAMLWTLGHGLLFRPSKPLRVLILETEEHKSDYLDIVPGVMKYAEMQRLEFDLEQIDDRLVIQSVAGLCGEELIDFLAGLIDESFEAGQPFDLVVINPALSFMGGNASEQEAVTNFLRNQLDPLVKRTGKEVGLLIIHHTKKVNADSAKYSNNDAMYATFGSSEWTNASRLIVTIQPYKNRPGYYEAIGAKRGASLGWKNADGETTIRKIIAHAKQTDEYGNPTHDRYWRIPDETEIAEIESQTTSTTKADRAAEQMAGYAETCAGWFQHGGTVMERPDFEERCSKDLKLKANKATTIRNIIKELQASGFACEQFGMKKGRKNPFYIGKKKDLESYREQLKREEQAAVEK